MAGRRLRLRRYAVANVNFQRLGAYRLRVVADDPENTGADPNVFLFLRRPPDPVTGQVLDDFHAIASPADLAEYPVGEPSPQTTYPFFRYDQVVLDLRGVALADEVWLAVLREVGVLQRALDKLDELVVVDEQMVGEPGGPDAGGASSGSSGSSASG